MARYAGKTGVFYLATSGSGNAINVAGLRSWSLDFSTDKIDVTAMGDTNKQQVLGLPSGSGSLSFWWDDSDDTVFTAATSSDGSKFYLYPTNLITGEYWYGTCWVDYSVEGAVDGAIGVTVNLAAKGNWAFKQNS